MIGAFVLLRFLGQLMKARRAVHEQEQQKKKDRAVQKRKEFIKKNEGKIFVIPKDTAIDESDVEDTSHKEI
ncbi:MAG: hypothetical protein J0G96_03685 [Flavobacteriia bacterium]|nr:hypothetical protein [Flavobacteriia bacterium]